MIVYKICMVLLAALFSLAGACLSLVSILEHVSVTSQLGFHSGLCAISQTLNCEAVIKSPFSTFLWLPLGSYGFAFYLTVLALALQAKRNRALWQVVLVLSGVSVLLSLFLLLVSTLYIKTLCPVCIGMYLSNFALLFLALIAGAGEAVGRRFDWGSQQISRLLRGVFGRGDRGDIKAARRWARRLLLLFIWSAALPFLFENFLTKQAIKSEAVKLWEAQPVTTFSSSQEGVLAKDYSKGESKAPIQIVEFSDFECPGCRRFGQFIEDVIVRYPGKISVTFRNFPLDRSCNRLVTRNFHQHACFAAEYARCAGEQGRFWEVAGHFLTANVFDLEGDPLAVREVIRSADKVLALDTEAIDQCLSSGRQREKIKADIEEGITKHVNGTPAVWVNGRQVLDPSPDVMRTLIDHILE